LCGGWDKSSAQVQHTPLVSNGVVDDTKGFLSVSTIIQTGNPIVGSDIIYDVVAGPASSFPVELQVFKDDGINGFLLDGQDSFVESNIETTVTDGPFTTNFQPYDMNMIVVVKANSGCIDKVIAVQNSLILPLKLMNFQGSLDKTNVSLAWTIGENQFADRFEVERSTNGKDFSSVGMVFASSLSGDEDYEFRDNMPSSGKAFYRLKMYDKSQKAEYSRTLLFQKEMKASALTIINNPATDKLSLSFNATSGNKAAISLYDLGGRKVMTREITVYEGTNSFSFSLPVSLQSGMYIAEVYTGTERITARFVKQ
ncbi:MAG TPA: T9SS type A sorting domain-containing protein, partial [Chitinophagaceae bacterium]|nr:T9SS type A sorting domain-containing protein [Chitinophagaceae bacterium]